MQHLFGLCYEYQRRNGATLEFFAEDGLHAGALSQLQMKMLRIGKIPRILPITAEYKDDCVRLIYELGPRRMLAQWLRTERIGRTQMLQLLLSVAATLAECRSYMLRESGFIIRSEFLFVGQDGTDVAFVYLPLKEIGVPPLGEELHRFIEELADKLPDSDRKPLLSLAEYCGSVSFRLGELKRKLLLELTEGGLPERIPNPEPSLSVPASYEPNPGYGSEAAANAPLTLSVPTGLNTKKLSAATAAAGVVCSAWLWSQYAETPSQPMLFIAFGATLLAADVTFMLRYLSDGVTLDFFKRRFRWKAVAAAPLLAAEVPVEPWELDGEEPLRWNRRDVPDSMEDRTTLPDIPRFVPVDIGPAADQYYAGLRHHTTLLAPPADATVLLIPGASSSERVASRAYIEIDGEWHEARRIHLNKPNFVIGRSGELSDLRIEQQGVSRQHIEIYCEQGRYSARDLGSTNGTLLNSEAMAPYQPYPLADGDCLIVAETRLSFHLV